MTYSQKLRDPRWQKVRLQIFERDGWKCQQQGCGSRPETPLAVHHKRYERGREPWDYPLENFLTLCEKCHDKAHGINVKRGNLVEGDFYEWRELPGLLGFAPRGYLTEDERRGEILCGCFKLDHNPDAPDILLAGDKADVVQKARLFARQKQFIPIFVKATDTEWEYCGKYRVETFTSNKAEIAIQGERSERDEIAVVLFLEKEK